MAKFTENQKLKLNEALYCYSEGSAKALGEEDVGRLKTGSYADFIVLDSDPFSISERNIQQLKAKEIYVGGKKSSVTS